MSEKRLNQLFDRIDNRIDGHQEYIEELMEKVDYLYDHLGIILVKHENKTKVMKHNDFYGVK